jgi:hypothetical protein
MIRKPTPKSRSAECEPAMIGSIRSGTRPAHRQLGEVLRVDEVLAVAQAALRHRQSDTVVRDLGEVARRAQNQAGGAECDQEVAQIGVVEESIGVRPRQGDAVSIACRTRPAALMVETKWQCSSVFGRSYR